MADLSAKGFPISSTCEGCGAEIDAPRRRFCSTICTKRVYRREAAERRALAWPTTCPCGEEFAHPPGAGRPRRYCSDRCKDWDARLRQDWKRGLAWYFETLAAQGGGCAICGDTPADGRRLDVDHDHETGRIRGLLCMPCNIGIGNLREDPARLAAAIEYLGAAA